MKKRWRPLIRYAHRELFLAPPFAVLFNVCLKALFVNHLVFSFPFCLRP
jgi:hypothetical protein